MNKKLEDYNKKSKEILITETEMGIKTTVCIFQATKAGLRRRTPRKGNLKRGTESLLTAAKQKQNKKKKKRYKNQLC